MAPPLANPGSATGWLVGWFVRSLVSYARCDLIHTSPILMKFGIDAHHDRIKIINC